VTARATEARDEGCFLKPTPLGNFLQPRRRGRRDEPAGNGFGQRCGAAAPAPRRSGSCRRGCCGWVGGHEGAAGLLGSAVPTFSESSQRRREREDRDLYGGADEAHALGTMRSDGVRRSLAKRRRSFHQRSAPRVIFGGPQRGGLCKGCTLRQYLGSPAVCMGCIGPFHEPPRPSAAASKGVGVGPEPMGGTLALNFLGGREPGKRRRRCTAPACSGS
jgi:hypothetical protein